MEKGLALLVNAGDQGSRFIGPERIEACRGLGFSDFERTGAVHRSGLFKFSTMPKRHFKEEAKRPILFTSEHLRAFTNNFNVKNLIGPTQFGKVYRGKIERGLIGMEAQDVTVKIWDEKSDYIAFTNDDYAIVNEEVMFLTHPSVNHHPNLVKLIGYCREEQVKGVVYDLNPLDTLHNLTVKDDFTWLQRIKAALGFARLLEFLHGQENPYLVLNIDADHIMVDQDCNPILFDFGLMCGGIIGEQSYPKQFVIMSPGYVDSWFAAIAAPWSACADVFSYGVILLGLIAKRIVDKKNLMYMRIEDLVDEWAKSVYKPKCSLVHNSLEEEWGYYAADGPVITELGMRCVEFHPRNRPTMKEVAECLEGLLVLQLHSDALDM